MRPRALVRDPNRVGPNWIWVSASPHSEPGLNPNRVRTGWGREPQISANRVGVPDSGPVRTAPEELAKRDPKVDPPYDVLWFGPPLLIWSILKYKTLLDTQLSSSWRQGAQVGTCNCTTISMIRKFGWTPQVALGSMAAMSASERQAPARSLRLLELLSRHRVE